LDVLHGTLRCTEHVITTNVFYALQMGNSLKEINNWIQDKVFNHTGGVTIKISDDVKSNEDIVNLTFNSIKVNFGSENDRLKLVYEMPKFIDHFFNRMDENFFLNQPINLSFYQKTMAERISLFADSLEKHKRRHLLHVEEVKSSEAFKNIVNSYINTLLHKLNEKDQKQAFIQMAKEYSNNLLLVLMIARNGIPRSKEKIKKNNFKGNENELIDESDELVNEDEIIKENENGKEDIDESVGQYIEENGKEDIDGNFVDNDEQGFDEEDFENIEQDLKNADNLMKNIQKNFEKNDKEKEKFDKKIEVENDNKDEDETESEFESEENNFKINNKKTKNKFKFELNKDIEKKWELLIDKSISEEEALDFFDMLIQDWCLVARHVPTKQRGYYGNFILVLIFDKLLLFFF
jgi:hypothetical protein